MKLGDVTVALTALLLPVLGAQAQAYSPLSKDISYCFRMLSNGGVKVDNGCYVQLLLSAAKQKGNKVFEQVCWLPVGEDPERNSLEASLKLLSQGDSADFTMPAKILLSSLTGYPRVEGVTGSETLHVGVRVLRVVERDIILDDAYEKFCEDYQRYERRLIVQYIRKRSGFKAAGDIWKKQEKPGNGKKASKAGSSMNIAYEGFFLNGVKFDSNGKSGQPFRYVRGQQWQVIQGLALALAGMSEGEKATFIFPSTLAFGVKGLADIVRPFSPVVYEVEVLNVVDK